MSRGTGRSAERLFWSTKPVARAPKAQLDAIPPFSARGMRRIYGRGDHFPGLPTYNLDVWLTKERRIMVRFWSRGSFVDPCSYELRNGRIPVDTLSSVPAENESHVPLALRAEYEDWVIDRVEYPYE